MNKFKNWIFDLLKGIGIGLACIIPGVSGGTVALVTKIYDKMVGKTYLLAYSSSKNQPLKVVEIAISEENFWHLLGC